MRLKRKAISFDMNTYEGLEELRHQYKCSFGEVILKYVPMPFFDAPVSKSYPVVKRKVNKTIPKRKYNYTADLEDFEANKCKSLNLQPMKPPRKKQVLISEYDEATQRMIDEEESSKNAPWLWKNKNKRKKVPV